MSVLTKKFIFAAAGLLLCAIGAFFLLASGPRAIVVVGDTTNPAATTTASMPSSTDPAASGTAATNSGAPGTIVDDIPAVVPTDWNQIPSSWVLTGTSASTNESAYNAKLLTLANPPVVSKTTKVSSTITNASGTIVTVWKTVMTTSTAKTGWPAAKNVYPNQGALLPFNRIVAYYGNFYSTQMGVLGQYPENVVLAKLASTTALWQAADPATHVIPAIQYIVVTAQGSAGKDGKYRLRMPDDQVEKAIAMADKVDGVVFLDFQVGLSNVETEVPLYEKYLKMPRVFLALDPEFDMPGSARPGTVIGTMSATDINWAAQYLATLVRDNHLPPKILVIHRFTDAMVQNTMKIQPLPEVQIVMDMDGFGFPAKKINTYQQVIIPYPIEFTGFKLFYKNDTLGPLGRLMTPQEVLKLGPQPSYIQYQ